MANEAVAQEMINITESTQYGDMSPFYLNKVFSDITLMLDNGLEIHAHKIVLAARCKHFGTLLLRDPTLTRFTLTNVSSEIFQIILKFVYTGCFSIDASNGELIFDVLKLAHEYSMKDLEKVMEEKVISILDVANVSDILNKGTECEMFELVEKCHIFIENNFTDVLNNGSFNNLTQKSIVKFLKRDSLQLPEIEIFKIAEKWCKNNEDVDGLVIKCVRLSLLNSHEIFSTVWPSKLIDNETLMATLETNLNTTSVPSKCRSGNSLMLVMEKNIASAEFKAKVISGINTALLLSGNQDLAQCANHMIGDESGITVDLGEWYYINHIKMLLKNADNIELNRKFEYVDKNFSSYRYYIEVSKDQKKWDRIIDYTNYDCRSYQSLFFDQRIAQYVRIVGTYCSTSSKFEILDLEIYCKNEIPSTSNQMIRPTQNVAMANMGALVIDGRKPACLLTDLHKSDNWTYHVIDDGNVTVQLAQPYIISNIKFRLPTADFSTYGYFIETSVNKTDWEIATDRRSQDCSDWQDLDFMERPVVYVRITGTQTSKEKFFYCTCFQCFNCKSLN